LPATALKKNNSLKFNYFYLRKMIFANNNFSICLNLENKMIKWCFKMREKRIFNFKSEQYF